MKKEIINKRVAVEMLIDIVVGSKAVRGFAIITNGNRQMTIAFEHMEKYFK